MAAQYSVSVKQGRTSDRPDTNASISSVLVRLTLNELLNERPDVTARPFTGSVVHARIVYDLVYNPEDTALQRDARTRGAVTIGGLEMLVGQAVRQSEWWTGRTPSPAVMTEAARAWIAATKVSD